jgi:uncharacterized phage protein (TIGR01671 family)
MNTDRFKFRAWYKKPDGKYEMIYDIQASYDNLAGGMGSAYHFNFQDIINDEDAVIEQCTGLTDKNGKLIYEGDVVLALESWSDRKREFNVIYCKKDYGFLFVDNYQNTKALFAFLPEELEIVGNIHEDQFRDVTKLMED